ncbi:putative phage abortive infection protein [Photobacterium halotolerans]|uniref:putative phage abortive infection protein n=1 Tax=Photobacterium halotolerans TaxID=265726 RepID=UPI0009DC0AC2|nr:putative phage abortive infection protein [Photobacterium halotolerans]
MNSEKKSGFMGYLLIPMLLAIISITWFFYPSWMGYVFTPKDSVLQGNLGTLGDSFGALNTLFSGLAFAGIIVSIYLQSKELKETREEIKAQGDQFKLQTQALDKQNFENTFFKLLSLYNECLQSIKVKSLEGYNRESVLFESREAIQHIYLNKFIGDDYIFEFSDGKEYHGSASVEKFENLMKYMSGTVGHYFRTIYQILKFVDESNVVNKKFYTNLLRAQLSNYELALIFYNCLSHHGSEKFKPLTERYQMFEHLIEVPDISRDLVVKYDMSAFGVSNNSMLEMYDLVPLEEGC